MWIMGISYLVPTNVKSRSEYPKNPLFEEFVEVVPGTDNIIGSAVDGQVCADSVCSYLG